MHVLCTRADWAAPFKTPHGTEETTIPLPAAADNAALTNEGGSTGSGMPGLPASVVMMTPTRSPPIAFVTSVGTAGANAATFSASVRARNTASVSASASAGPLPEPSAGTLSDVATPTSPLAAAAQYAPWEPSGERRANLDMYSSAAPTASPSWEAESPAWSTRPGQSRSPGSRVSRRRMLIAPRFPVDWENSVLAIVDFEDFWETLFSFLPIKTLVRFSRVCRRGHAVAHRVRWFMLNFCKQAEATLPFGDQWPASEDFFRWDGSYAGNANPHAPATLAAARLERNGGEFFGGSKTMDGWNTRLAHVKLWQNLPFKVDIFMRQWQRGSRTGDELTVVDCPANM